MFVDRRSIITTLNRTADISSHFMHKLYFCFSDAAVSLLWTETNCSVVQQNFDGIISHGVYFFLLHSSRVADLCFGEKMGSEQGGTLHMKTWSW